jgi:predicted sugar kinase
VTTIPDPQIYREVFAVLVQHDGRATVVDGSVFDSREVADRVAENVSELHPDATVVRLLVRSTPAAWHGLPVVEQAALAAAVAAESARTAQDGGASCV